MGSLRTCVYMDVGVCISIFGIKQSINLCVTVCIFSRGVCSGGAAQCVHVRRKYLCLRVTPCTC